MWGSTTAPTEMELELQQTAVGPKPTAVGLQLTAVGCNRRGLGCNRPQNRRAAPKHQKKNSALRDHPAARPAFVEVEAHALAHVSKGGRDRLACLRGAQRSHTKRMHWLSLLHPSECTSVPAPVPEWMCADRFFSSRLVRHVSCWSRRLQDRHTPKGGQGVGSACAAFGRWGCWAQAPWIPPQPH